MWSRHKTETVLWAVEIKSRDVLCRMDRTHTGRAASGVRSNSLMISWNPVFSTVFKFKIITPKQ